MPLSAYLFFTPAEVLIRGFNVISGLPNITSNDYNENNIEKFKQHFGSTPTVIAFVWSDILTTDIDLGLEMNDKSERGFKKILTAIHFLWAYPKNNGILLSTCATCKQNVEGDKLWKYIKVLSKLKDLKIVWPEDQFRDPDGIIFLGTVDGVDFKTREKSSDELNVDNKQFLFKHNHGSLKYEVMVHAYLPKIVWINGPFQGGEHDRTIFNSALAKKIPQGKMVITDGVYSKQTDVRYQAKLSLPNLCDSKKLHNFKAPLRSRHEAVNGKLVKYQALSNEYHHAHAHHCYIFEAICTLVQYAMDHGSPIWDA